MNASLSYIALLFLSGSILASCSCAPNQNQIDQEKKRLISLETKNKIKGRWTVAHSTLIPFEHISFCKLLGEGAIFEFNDSTLVVFEHPDSLACNDYQKFWITDQTISILEWDMLFGYPIIKLNADTLVIKIDELPEYIFTTPNISDEELSAKIKEIGKKGIVVTMIRMK